MFAVLATAVCLLGLLAMPREACASILNAGAEAGAITRTADDPDNLKWGFGWGVHGELGLLPLLNIGPYYMHYELAPTGGSSTTTEDAIFNTLGLRMRLLVPVPGSSWKPYAYLGAGYAWVTYPSVPLASTLAQPARAPAGLSGNTSGHFFEIPIGLGVAYEFATVFHVSADVAYRPGKWFGGAVYDDAPTRNQPSSGWSVLLGAALDL